MEKELVAINREMALSTKMFNHSIFGGLSRNLHRANYRGLAEDWIRSKEHLRMVEQYLILGDRELDTYPAAYSHPKIATWNEDDSDKNYSLISDPALFVIRHSTSYCAYKIREVMGKWPLRCLHERYDAKDWDKFLDEDQKFPLCEGGPECWGFYVGVEQDTTSEFGEVVWFEGEADKSTGMVLVSTYRIRHHWTLYVKPENYHWYFISTVEGAQKRFRDLRTPREF